MKKLFIALFSIVLSVTALSACSVKKVENTETPTATATQVATPIPTAEPWEINSFTEGVPVITFGSKAFESVGDSFLAMYDDVLIEDIESYIAELKANGFSQTDYQEADTVKYTLKNSDGKTVVLEHSAGTMTVNITK